jgi:hypothetical protein
MYSICMHVRNVRIQNHREAHIQQCLTEDQNGVKANIKHVERAYYSTITARVVEQF